MEGVIEDEGPFDGILGFSQGCSVAAALMFERQKADKGDVPFRFGVFMGASLPFNADDKAGKQAWEAASRPGGTDPKNEFKGERELKGQPGMISFPDVDNQPVWLGRYHSQKTPDTKLQIPILHVIGKKDPYALQAKELASAMHENPHDSVILEHNGGHEVPREPLINDKIAHHMSNMIATLTIPAF